MTVLPSHNPTLLSPHSLQPVLPIITLTNLHILLILMFIFPYHQITLILLPTHSPAKEWKSPLNPKLNLLNFLFLMSIFLLINEPSFRPLLTPTSPSNLKTTQSSVLESIFSSNRRTLNVGYPKETTNIPNFLFLTSSQSYTITRILLILHPTHYSTYMSIQS